MPPLPSAFADALVLTGPTASGKSAVALTLAEQIGAEIVAMDSMTLYRGMDIGTAKPTAEDQARVRHHLIDVLDPWEAGNVAWWLDRAADACVGIRDRGRRPLFVGGTPFYLKALRCGLFDAPPSDSDLRRRLESEAAATGPDATHARLSAVDPIAAARLHRNDVRRVVRALEVHELTGRPISEFQTTWNVPDVDGPNCVVLEWPRDELYRRINVRVGAMLAAGWLDEVRRLSESPDPLSTEASQALGYRELADFLSGEGGSSWAETVELIRTRTRQFAKRQLTWFRRLPLGQPIPADHPDVLDQIRTRWAAGTEPTFDIHLSQ